MMTPDLQMTTRELFTHSGRAPMPSGLREAAELLREIDRLAPGSRPAELSMVKGALTVTIWGGTRFFPFVIDEADFGRDYLEVAADIAKMKRDLGGSR